VLPTRRDERYIEFFRKHPFIHLDEVRIRTRAYYLSCGKEARGDTVADWMEAEWRELVTELMGRVSFIHLGATGGADEFVEMYQPVVYYTFAYDEQRQLLIGERDSRRCTLCGHVPPLARFGSAAHVIPEALGNKTLKTRDECDACNSRYGRSQDNELATFLRPELSLARVPGKGGPKKYSLGTGRSSLGGAGRADPVSVAVREGDSSFVIDYTERGVSIKTPGVSFAPIGAMKSMARATWHVLGPERQARYAELRRWLCSEIEAGPMVLHHGFVPGTGMARLGLFVWESRAPAPRPLVTMMFSGHSLLVLFLPLDFAAGNGGVVAFPPLPRTIPPMKITAINAEDSGRIDIESTTFDIVIGGDAFPMSIGETYPVVLSTAHQQWKAGLLVLAADDRTLQYKICAGALGVELRVHISRVAPAVEVASHLDFTRVPIEAAVAALELMCSLHDGTHVSVGVDEGRGPRRLFTLCNAPNIDAAGPWKSSLDLAQAVARVAARLGLPLHFPESPDDTAVIFFAIDQITRTGKLIVEVPGQMVISLSPEELNGACEMLDAGEIALGPEPHALRDLQGYQVDLGPYVTRVIGTRRVGGVRPSVSEPGWFDIDVEYQHLVVRYSRWRPVDEDA
jgi:hypothetical protein